MLLCCTYTKNVFLLFLDVERANNNILHVIDKSFFDKHRCPTRLVQTWASILSDAHFLKNTCDSLLFVSTFESK